MNLKQFKDVFEDYSLSINDKVTFYFSFEEDHKIQHSAKSTLLSNNDLAQIKNTIEEFFRRDQHRQQLIQEIIDYAYKLPNESELKQLLSQVEEIKGIPTSLIIEKLSDRSPAFIDKRLHELLQTIQEEKECQR